MDIIKQLGELALASRLRRVADRLGSDVCALYKDLQITFEPRWFGVFYVLSQHGPLSICDIAEELGVSHPSVNQVAGELEKAGLAETLRDDKDKRKRLIALSDAGQAMVPRLKPVWDAVGLAARDLVLATGYDILDVLERLEGTLEQNTFYDRITAHIKRHQRDVVEILVDDDRYWQAFYDLNADWIQEYFQFEAGDHEVLSDPKAHILDAGGHLFFARLGDRIVGTCALKKMEDTTYELCKMAVDKAYRGRQIGRKLLEAVIEKARDEWGAETLVLGTNTKLTPAIRLYRQLGFVLIPQETVSLCTRFARTDMIMRLDLTQPQSTSERSSSGLRRGTTLDCLTAPARGTPDVSEALVP